mgnify:CR=1 FL=1
MLKKAIQKSGNTCKVTFVLPAEVNAETACLCGDFNDWDATQHSMKNINFATSQIIPVGKMITLPTLTL